MIKYLTLEQILKLHDAVVEKFGGLSGIRDSNLLLSSIESPKQCIYLTSFVIIPLTMVTKELEPVPPIYFCGLIRRLCHLTLLQRTEPMKIS